MDPVSIAQAIGGLYKASETIYLFIQETQVVDSNILNLQRQVDGLARVLETLSQALQGKSYQDESVEKRQLWRSVAESLEACYPTIRELDEKLHGVRGISGKKDFFTQAKKVFRLRMDEEEIDKLLSTMQTHSINLQLALGIVQLMIAASAPETLAQELESRFERLERMMLMVDERLATQSYPLPTPSPGGNQVNSVKLDDNTKNLRRSAATIITSATTARGRSVSGMTRQPTLDFDQPAFDHFDPPNANQRTIIEESTTGSELGKPIDPTQRTHIHSWLQVSSFDSADVREGPSEEASTATPSDTLTSIFSGISIASDTTANAPTLEIFNESSDEDDFEVQVIKNFLARAETKMQNQDFVAAQELLQRGLDETRHISEKKRQDLNLSDVRLQYAECCVRCGRMEESEATFSSLARQEVKDVQDATRVLHALHGLAGINLRKRNFEAATTHCRQALNGRRRTKTIGKRHADYFASLRLLALISWAKNDKVQAEAFADMLPKESKMNAQSIADALHKEYGISEASTMPSSRLNRTLSPDTQVGPGLERRISGESFAETDRSSVASPQPQVQQTSNIPSRHERSPSIPVQTPKIGMSQADKDDLRPSVKEMEISPYDSQHAQTVLQLQNPQGNDGSIARRPVQTSPGVINFPATSPIENSHLPRPVEYSTNVNSPPQSPNLGKKDPDLALLAAVKSRDVDLARILCQGFGQKKKADVNVRGERNVTPLILACATANLDMCTILLANRALVNLHDENENTALMTAVLAAPMEICQLLISHDADVNLVNRKGWSALMFAAHTSRLALCELLISSGAKLDTRDVQGKDALALATNSAVRRLLLRRPSNDETHSNRSSVRYTTRTNSVPDTGNSSASLDQFDVSIRGMIQSVMSTGVTLNQIEENIDFFQSYLNQRHDKIAQISAISEDSAAQAEVRLLTNGFLQGTGRFDSSNAMFWAVKNFYYSVVVLLLSCFSVNLGEQQVSDGSVSETVLHLAARKGNYDICVLLLDSGAAVNAFNSQNVTPLAEAVQKGRIDVVKLLVDRGAWRDNAGGGATPLTIAAKANNIGVCQVLLQQGADPNKPNQDGNSALELASKHINLDLYRLLITSGADQTEVRADKHTCFTRAADEDNINLLTLIIETGYDINQIDGKGFAALHYAARKSNSTMCISLLKRGAKVDIRARDSGSTPLVSAVVHKSLVNARLLLEAGANPNTVDTKNGLTPMMWATESCAGMMDLLWEKGASVKMKTKRGSTALMFAAKEDQLAACMKLISWGAEVNAVNEMGETAISRAASKEIKKYLKAYR